MKIPSFAEDRIRLYAGADEKVGSWWDDRLYAMATEFALGRRLSLVK